MSIKSIFLLFLLVLKFSLAQAGKISGEVKVGGKNMAYVTISVAGLSKGTITNNQGEYVLDNMPLGKFTLSASFVGYLTVHKTVVLSELEPEQELDFILDDEKLDLNEVVITGTKTHEYKKNSPILVSTVSSKVLEDIQACNLSDGLKFQPGLRVENNCQTCNYTQLRMNGLAGGYSQVLINGRPIFSPLTGLYGLEQLPANMIERIEVVSGGGSSLYGSSAIGGSVNVITKIPSKNSYSVDYSYQLINGKTNENNLLGNASVISKNAKSGISLFITKRQRAFYDHNDDNFSELPKIENTSFGINAFFLPKENHKLEFSISNLNEYRFGGEMVDKPAYLTQQSEERTHHVWMGSVDYQINSKNQKLSFITYLAWQHTSRHHYTGILPDSGIELQNHLENAPYGLSSVTTLNVGLQLNYKIDKFITGENIVTLGTEYIDDDVYDKIPSYSYIVDQTTKDFGMFLQSNWAIYSKLRLLSGVRMDAHNLIDKIVVSPRLSLLYKPIPDMQIRLNYGAGFRAPQAFDTDLHIAFAGGGVSRVRLNPSLQPEKSSSLSSSISYDKPAEHLIAGITIEGFYTEIHDVFVLRHMGEDVHGELFEKRNGQGALVMGFTIELRANFDKKAQLESGFTGQISRFDNPVQHINNVEGIRDFIRTPNRYGYTTFTFTPNKKINAMMTYIYTGTMQVPHFAGAPNQHSDEIINSERFHELNFKVGYTLKLTDKDNSTKFYVGMKNILNSYQSSFDLGKNRDSNFVYGPAIPRAVYIGLKFTM